MFSVLFLFFPTKLGGTKGLTYLKPIGLQILSKMETSKEWKSKGDVGIEGVLLACMIINAAFFDIPKSPLKSKSSSTKVDVMLFWL